MTSREWLAATHPVNLWYNRFVRDDRRRRLVVCACARRVLSLLRNDPRAVALIEACERHADSSKMDAPALWKEVVAARLAVRALLRETEGEPDNRRLSAVRAIVWSSEAHPSTAKSMFNWAAQALHGAPSTPGGAETRAQLDTLRDIFRNPFRPVTFSPEWRTDTAVSLARTMYESRDFSAMPVLADALQDAGCDNEDILNHGRRLGEHVRGCWVVDLVLGKE